MVAQARLRHQTDHDPDRDPTPALRPHEPHHRAPVACFHPGSPALVGRPAVLESWRQILGGCPGFALRCDQPVAHVVGDAAIVTCYEGSDDDPAHLAATNVFVFEDGTWRMVHHHAGPLSRPVARGRAAPTMN